MRNFLRCTAMAALTTLVTMPGALALDGTDFADKLAATFATGGMKVEYGSAAVDGDKVTISGFAFTPPGEEPTDVPGALVFTGVTENGDGSYRAAKATMDDIDVSEDEFAVSIKNILIEELYIPASPVVDPLSLVAPYQRMTLGPVSVSMDGKEVVSIANVEAFTTPNDTNTSFDSGYDVTGIHADLSIIEEEEAQAMLALFGFQTIDADAKGRMAWSLDDGHLAVTESAITIANVGRLNVTLDLHGYDAEVLKSIQAMQVHMSEMDMSDPEAMDEPSMETMNVMLEKLSLGSFSFRFEDGGITGKVLDFIAQSQGAPREVMAAGFAAAVPAMAAEAGVPAEVQAMLGEAAAAFLENPQSLEIRVAPATPIPFSAFAAAADDPASMLSEVNLSVTANQ